MMKCPDCGHDLANRDCVRTCGCELEHGSGHQTGTPPQPEPTHFFEEEAFKAHHGIAPPQDGDEIIATAFETVRKALTYMHKATHEEGATALATIRSELERLTAERDAARKVRAGLKLAVADAEAKLETAEAERDRLRDGLWALATKYQHTDAGADALAALLSPENPEDPCQHCNGACREPGVHYR